MTMQEYRAGKKQIVFDCLSQLKELFPVHNPGNYETICYNNVQEKLYNIAKKYGCIKTLKKYGVLD